MTSTPVFVPTLNLERKTIPCLNYPAFKGDPTLNDLRELGQNLVWKSPKHNRLVAARKQRRRQLLAVFELERELFSNEILGIKS